MGWDTLTDRWALSLPRREDFGELIVTRHWDDPSDPGPGWITIDRADPRIRVSYELVDMAAKGETHPCFKLYTTCTCPEWMYCEHPTKLEVHGRDRKVLYVLKMRWPGEIDFVAEWPD